MVFLTDSIDRVLGKTGASLIINLSKNGGAFETITTTVTERGFGWYNVLLTTTHTNTLGVLSLHIEAEGADPTDLSLQVIELIAKELTSQSILEGINTIKEKVTDIHHNDGLEQSDPLIITPERRKTNRVDLKLTGDGISITTVSRQS